VALAVACLRTRDEGLLAAAVHATGILGSHKQVPHLANVLKRVSDRFARRQITEAIVRASAR
jgi:hypothetical protein